MQEKGFFGALFDISFASFITTKIIKVLYVIAMVVAGLIALAYVIAAFTASVGLGLLTLVVFAPLAFLLYVIYTRVFLELVMVIFRIMETNTELVALQRGAYGGPPPSPPPYSPPPQSPPPYTRRRRRTRRRPAADARQAARSAAALVVAPRAGGGSHTVAGARALPRSPP